MERLARYELIAKIATGGMAEIWVATANAESRSLGVTAGAIYVVKKLLPQHKSNDEFIRMFREEARLATTLRHPNIVRTFEASSEAGIHYLVMEYLHGEDLRTISRKLRADSRRIPLEHALAIIAGAAAGLHHAHDLTDAQGVPLEIVHRDVSPHNVFVGFDGSAKVVDFGIAKSRERSWETRHGTLKGKVPYMSPEQIKTRRLDRRTDVYSLGVVLYELLLGQRPYVLTSGGDFALMMAIARHDVRPPSEVDPTIDRELERLVLRAMAYDPRQRYPSCEDLRRDIVAFAAARGLDVSPEHLAGWMESLFGARIEAWRAAALASGALAAHVVQVEEERAQLDGEDEGDATSIDDPDSTMARPQTAALQAAPSAAASLVASTSAAIAAIVDVLGVTVVSLQGRIDETFEGAALGGSLGGTVLFDLKAVERITSFGVREWLEMMGAIADTVTDVWLARCPEPIVTQMALVRSFPERAKLLSFDAPFLCDDCGLAFPKLLDCERDADWYRGRVSAVECPRCGGRCKLDDDIAFFSFAGSHAGRVVPERLRTVLATVEQGDRSSIDVVDKVVSADETRVRVLRDVDGSVRWNRILDGIEGRLVLDFRGGRHVSAEGASALRRALDGLGREVTAIEINDCPLSLFAALGERAFGDRPKIASVVIDGKCEACRAARSGLAPAAALRAAVSGGQPPTVPCRRCGGPLDVASALPLLRTVAPVAPASAPVLAAAVAPAPSARSSSRLPISAPAVTRDARPPAVAEPTRAHTLYAAGFGVFAAVCIVVFAFGLHRHLGAAADASSSPSSESAPPSSPSAAASAPAVTHGASGVEVAVRVQGSDVDATLATARDRAVALIVGEIERALPPAVARAVASAPPGDAAALAERFRRDVGTFASPERAAVEVEGTPGAIDLRARYVLDEASFRRAVAHYGATREVGGYTLSSSFPSRRDGLVVVDATDAGVPSGSLLVALDGRSLASLDALGRASAAQDRAQPHDASFLVAGAITARKLDVPRVR